MRLIPNCIRSYSRRFLCGIVSMASACARRGTQNAARAGLERWVSTASKCVRACVCDRCLRVRVRVCARACVYLCLCVRVF